MILTDGQKCLLSMKEVGMLDRENLSFTLVWEGSWIVKGDPTTYFQRRRKCQGSQTKNS